MDFKIRLLANDLHLLPMTNIGAFTQAQAQDADKTELGTCKESVFDAWCKTLRESNCPFDIIS